MAVEVRVVQGGVASRTSVDTEPIIPSPGNGIKPNKQQRKPVGGRKPPPFKVLKIIARWRNGCALLRVGKSFLG